MKIWSRNFCNKSFFSIYAINTALNFVLIFKLKDCIEFGHDLYGGDVATETANNYKECHKRCSEIPACKTWTFSSADQGDCYLWNKPNGTLVPTRHCKTGHRSSKNIKCSTKGIMEITYYASLIVLNVPRNLF